MTNDQKKNLCLSDEFVVGDVEILEISSIYRCSSSSGNVLLFFSLRLQQQQQQLVQRAQYWVLEVRTY